MSTIGCEVKLFNVIVELVLLKEGFQLLLGSKLHPTGAVDVDIPSASLLAMLTTFQLSYPTRR